MSFVPTVFISIGETNAYFTLRETYLHLNSDGLTFSIRTFHHFNLSQNAEEAFAKAKAFSEKMCIELTSDLESLTTQMREIKQASKDQLEKRRLEMERIEAESSARYEAYKEERSAKINSGFFVFGAYAGKAFSEAPRGYLSWMMDKVEDFEEGSVLRETAEAVIRLVPHLALPKPDKNAIIGKPKERLTFKNVLVLSSRNFVKQSFNGYGMEVCYVTTMLTEDKVCLVCFSGAFAPEEGEVLNFKATVKGHDAYNGQAQTIIQRVTILGEK